MKKVFTLILAMTVVFAGFAQVRQASKNDAKKQVATMKVTKGNESFANVQTEPHMLRMDGELDYTTYDWQTNAGIINRTIVWPDGKVNFAFTWASDESFSDRGTAIGTYDSENDEWIPSEGRVENEKTGFGSIARYRDNGIVVAAHTSTECGFYIIDDKDNIDANSLSCALRLSPTVDPSWPNVMTSGANRDIIHIIATGYSDNKLYYFRSRDGQTWDKENEIIPFLSEDYGSDWGGNVVYWMETTEDNCLAFVVNNAWSDCMVVYSYDDGDTWERKVFWHHPGINTTIAEDDWSLYPRWASCVWGPDQELRLAYEYNGTRGAPASGSYFPSIGGVAYWSETMPYHGDGTSLPAGPDPTNPLPPTPGNPFIMDTAYIMEDIHGSLWLYSDATHEMWDEYMGYLAPLTDAGDPEEDPYNAQEFKIEDRSLHGSYNSGCVAMPILCSIPGSDYDLVAIWCAMDENNTDGTNFYYKLFASYSADGGLTWAHQIQLTTDFAYTRTECVYPQAAVIGHTLVIACQTDLTTGAFVMNGESSNDNEASDNFYQGFTFDLDELFPNVGVGVPEVSSNTHMSLYPNPAVDQLNITLNKNANIVIYNIMGQKVMNVEGHVGANSINISELSAGVYTINAGNDTQKFVVK